MKNLKIKKLLPYAIASTLLLSGCGKKSECDYPTRHVHEYKKQVTSNIELDGYFDDEALDRYGYKWTDNILEITKVDEEFYQLLGRYGCVKANNNWDYLYYTMKNHHDYLKFYYEYDTIETYTTTDSKGNVETHTRTVHHDGWHDNPRSSNNTGKTRVYHHRYFGYRLVVENGKYKIEKSPAVDDIRDVLDDYPYVSEDCVTEVYETFKFRKSELPYLRAEEITPFNGPRLDQKELVYTKK